VRKQKRWTIRDQKHEREHIHGGLGAKQGPERPEPEKGQGGKGHCQDPNRKKLQKVRKVPEKIENYDWGSEGKKEKKSEGGSKKVASENGGRRSLQPCHRPGKWDLT